VLHPIESPACSESLRQAVELQRQLIEFACRDTTMLPLTREIVLGSFPPEIGRWLVAVLWRTKGGTSQATRLCKLVTAVIEYIQAHREICEHVLKAFDHDRDFDQKAYGSAFRFDYFGLDAAAKEVLGPLMSFFYEGIFARAGVPPPAAGEAKLTRIAFLQAFWKTNPRLNVCPACDDPKPDTVDVTPTDDVDHFLPKSIYPFLALHPYNLVPICGTCNSSCKLAKDPLDHTDDDPFLHSFHPYLRPALPAIDIVASRDNRGEIAYELRDRTPPLPRSRRVESMNRLLDLESRWRNRKAEGDVRQRFRIYGLQSARYGQSVNENELRSALDLDIQERPRRVGAEANTVLEISYLRFVKNDPTEFALLLDYYLDRAG
jgi:hypothetical protein